MSFTQDMLTGFAQLLDAGNVGRWAGSGVYPPDQALPGIVLQAMPSDPARLITLTDYAVDDAPGTTDDVIGLQVITRWDGEDPRPESALKDAVFDTLHGLHDSRLPTGVWVSLCVRRSGASLGQDGNQRWASSQNFYVTAWRPSTNRTDS